MKPKDEPDLEDMMGVMEIMDSLIQLAEIGLKYGKSPKEVADYLAQLFKEFNKNMCQLNHE